MILKIIFNNACMPVPPRHCVEALPFYRSAPEMSAKSAKLPGQRRGGKLSVLLRRFPTASRRFPAKKGGAILLAAARTGFECRGERGSSMMVLACGCCRGEMGMRVELKRSQALQRRAEGLLPGGVDSPVRAFRAVGGNPPFVERGAGSHLFDADGNSYLDYVLSWGPLLLGHARAEVVEAVCEAAARGTSFGASIAAEADLAEAIIAALPSIERLRFVNSGTEATMSAIRLARAATGREIVVKFEGCYHGHSDSLLVKAGSGVATFGIPGSAGVPESFARLTLALPYNDRAALEAAFAAHKNQIACVILEPVVGNMGCVPPDDGYLEFIRELTRREGALLICDEVMTGFRVAWGGAQRLYNLEPDLTTLGKVIGAGLPVAAYGGRAGLMDQISPLGPVYQAGTLSGNPLAMAAGLAQMKILAREKDAIYPRIARMTVRLASGIEEAARERGVALTANHVCGMFTLFFTGKKVRDWADAAACDTVRFGRFHRAMMESGVWLPPSQFEAAFLSAAHSEAEIEETIEKAKLALDFACKESE
jgi:glutamate-1-semialdehyde 2,1-aminomutase